MNKGLEQFVRRRAGGACEYCGMVEGYSPIGHVIDHIVARQHGGPTNAENLALACVYCNRAKGPNLTGIDPAGGAITRLFDPRRDDWDEHSERDGARIEGRTAIGRATVRVLDMNGEVVLAIRQTIWDEDH